MLGQVVPCRSYKRSCVYVALFCFFSSRLAAPAIILCVCMPRSCHLGSAHLLPFDSNAGVGLACWLSSESGIGRFLERSATTALEHVRWWFHMLRSTHITSVATTVLSSLFTQRHTCLILVGPIGSGVWSNVLRPSGGESCQRRLVPTSRKSDFPRWPVPDAACFSLCYNTEHSEAPATSALLLLETLPWIRPDLSFFEGLPPPAGRVEGKTHLLNAHPPLPSSGQLILLFTYYPILLARDARFATFIIPRDFLAAAAASTAPRVGSRYRPSSRRTSSCGPETVPVAPTYRSHHYRLFVRSRV